jgi:sodium/potassium-transporting ATPase subunit beta
LEECQQHEGKEKYNERVWIDCQGENPADRENLGPVIYHPTNGISKNYFPYRNQEGYLSPAIFVEFTQVKFGVMIAVECRAWADNIEHDRMDRRGLAHFELMID